MKPYIWKPLDEETKKRIEKAETFFGNVDRNNPELSDIGRFGRALIAGMDKLKEEKDGAYWERNMLALAFADYSNRVWSQFQNYLHETGSEVAGDVDNGPSGWYYDTDNNWEGWKRVVSVFNGKMTFHVPDDFDLGNLREIEPNWDGHSTEEKWWRSMSLCGCDIEPMIINGWKLVRVDDALRLFHPVFDGQFYRDFSTFAEAKAFATPERLEEWYKAFL
jgi:hypothetical protein